MAELRMRADTTLHVDYADGTAFGSPVGSRPEATAREMFAPVLWHVRSRGYGGLVSASPELLRRAVAGAAFRRTARPGRSVDSPWELPAELLFPAVNRAYPRGLTVSGPEGTHSRRFEFAADDWSWVHRVIAELCGPNGTARGDLVDPRARALVDELRGAGILCPVEAEPVSEAADGELEFVGHNTVVVRSRRATLVVDPLFFAHDPGHPDGYQPLRPADLGPLDAVLITHSHPDHFAPASLLRLPPTTRVVVPRVERETVLTVDMARRLRELGFDNVTELDWWQSTLVDDIEVHALPFHGEQPTDGPVLHPDIRNHGNTYLVRTPTLSAAFLADSGRDGQGEVREVAAQARARLGPVDVLFCGYRGWLIYPVQLLFTSVARYLAFVPPEQWNCRQRLMTTADEAVDIAERWGARRLVPYADGGAPWHWRVGLGPCLDESGGELHGFDPFPERVSAAARARTEMPDGLLGSAVEVLLLRPGDALGHVSGHAFDDLPGARSVDPSGEPSGDASGQVRDHVLGGAFRGLAGATSVRRRAGHAWPYDARGPLVAVAPLSRD
ncbi:MBL fold metallo-hydrolase [Streptomyces sp. SID3343]|uniref:MBL fold metallo-hydrolase n=1 Tax=Streptomyces sp. SID3343 TaxID=2690260 RepID=UPI0013696634|nr:MBL fold metallo-hydrolase [Streptomyces sp. SID3343]MYW00089.1 MBL fold metallo-hydrolase [Streptomyces sp. SID3343]